MGQRLTNQQRIERQSWNDQDWTLIQCPHGCNGGMFRHKYKLENEQVKIELACFVCKWQEIRPAT